MLPTQATTGDQLNIFINGCSFPAEKEDRETVAAELEAAVIEVLAEHGHSPDHMQIIDGHTYSSIQDVCPDCGDGLRLTEFNLDTENGGFARASCPCGWRGQAIYRLIDLQNPTEGSRSIEEELFEERSSVRLAGIEPFYTPY